MKPTISKTEIVRQIAAAHGQTQDNVRATIDALHELITAHTAEGAKVNLPGFGTFAVKHRPARLGRNPRTGESVQIEAKDSLTFKAAKPRKA